MSDIFNGIMRGINSLLGLLMVAGGSVWILQGLNIAFLNSFMAGQIEWTFWGILLVAVGVCQIVWSNTRAGYYRRKSDSSRG